MKITLPLPPSANRYMPSQCDILKSINDPAMLSASEVVAVTFWEARAMKSIPQTAGIYLVTNTVNGYAYIGSSVNLRKRWYLHRNDLKSGRHHNPRLLAAWNKYGAQAFTFQVLEHVSDKANLLKIEQAWLDKHDAANRRDYYNFCAIAGSQLGRKRSVETCKKLSVALTGKVASDATRAKQRAAKVGRKLTPEHIEKVRQKSIGRKYSRSEEYKSRQRKLSVGQVVEFRNLRRDGWTLSQLSRHFNIGNSTAQRIITGVSYIGVGE